MSNVVVISVAQVAEPADNVDGSRATHGPTDHRPHLPNADSHALPDGFHASSPFPPLNHGPENGRPHLASLIVLHGFTVSGRDHSRSWLPRLRKALPPAVLDCVRIVFLTAPKRRITCYADNPTELHAWHDYLTDHGGDEGRPDLEVTLCMYIYIIYIYICILYICVCVCVSVYMYVVIYVNTYLYIYKK